MQDDSWANVTEWRWCYLAQVPAHTMLVRDGMDGDLIFQLLNEGQLHFNHDDSSFHMFCSKDYARKTCCSVSTLELVSTAMQNYEAWLGKKYLHAMKGLPHYLCWCVLWTRKIQKCGDMAEAFS